MKRFFEVWVSGLLLLAVMNSAIAKDVYVKAGATGKGTKEDPYGELWRALDRAIRGDVIHVAKGTYHGKGGSGAFLAKVPDLTVVGGYDDSFSSRNPFKNFTILKRAKDFKGDATGLGEAIFGGPNNTDHSGLVVDGFVMNSASRNSYFPDGKLNPKESWNGSLFQCYSPNVAIRNCILLNPYGDGVYCTWKGEKNEISNTFVLNTFYTGISTRSAQPDSVITIKNCTVAFCWFQPGKGGGMCVFVGNKGKTIMENNIFAFAQTEGDAAGYAVSNTFGNDETVLKDNVFFQAQGGYYKYMDADGKSLIAWKPSDLQDLNGNGEDYMLAKASGNAEEDPKLMPDKDWYEKFSNFVASKPGKLNMDFMNQWRRSVGLPLQAEPGSPRKNWGMEYPLDKIIPNLVSKLKDRGPRVDGPFKEYKSSGAAEAKNYQEVAFDVFKKGSPEVKGMSNSPVQFVAGIGSRKMNWELKDAPRDKYTCFMILAPGKNEPTRDFVYGYFLNGSEALKNYEKYTKKKSKYNKNGITFKGTASYLGNDNYPYPVGVIVDDVSK